MQELAIKSQGFPELLRDTGAQSPLAGPFWSLSSMVMPTYQIGNSSIVPGEGFPFPFANFTSGIFVSPIINTVIGLTGILQRGFWALRMEGYAANSAVPGTFSRLQHNLWDGFANVQAEVFLFTDGGQRETFVRNWIQFNPGGMEFQVKTFDNWTGEISCSLKWLFLGLEFS